MSVNSRVARVCNTHARMQRDRPVSLKTAHRASETFHFQRELSMFRITRKTRPPIVETDAQVASVKSRVLQNSQPHAQLSHWKKRRKFENQGRKRGRKDGRDALNVLRLVT